MTRHPLGFRLLARGALLLALALAACGGSAATPTPASLAGNFAGTVPGTDAFVAIVVDRQNQALAYLCDTKEIGEWFRGTVGTGGGLNLTSDDGARLTAKVAPTGTAGTVTLAGRDLPFTAGPVTGDAGLYRQVQTVEGGQEVTGWIVLPNGQERGTASKPKGPRIPAPPRPKGTTHATT